MSKAVQEKLPPEDEAQVRKWATFFNENKDKPNFLKFESPEGKEFQEFVSKYGDIILDINHKYFAHIMSIAKEIRDRYDH